MTPEFEQRMIQNSGLLHNFFESLLLDHQHHYRRYKIKQKGKLRQIEEPSSELMALQKAFLIEIKDFPLHVACMARPGMSIRDNAAIHSQAKHLLKVDVKGCYQSITLGYTSFVMNSKYNHEWCKGYWRDIQECLPACFIELDVNDRFVLPTGAPTSPMLCNIALTWVDEQVSEIASKYGYQYTRYLDDLILSTSNSKREWRIMEEVKAVLIDNFLPPHPRKCRWYSGSSDRFIVTGVNVADKISAPREIKRLLRARIYSLAKEGKEIDNVTRGYLAHVKDIDPAYYLYMMDYYKRKRTVNVGTERFCFGLE